MSLPSMSEDEFESRMHKAHDMINELFHGKNTRYILSVSTLDAEQGNVPIDDDGTVHLTACCTVAGEAKVVANMMVSIHDSVLESVVQMENSDQHTIDNEIIEGES